MKIISKFILICSLTILLLLKGSFYCIIDPGTKDYVSINPPTPQLIKEYHKPDFCSKLVESYKRKGLINPDENNSVTILVSTAGDCTIGSDNTFSYYNSFYHELERQNNDYAYFFKNVKEFFENDDLTIVNLETTFTTATQKANKKFRFRGDPSYAQILQEGSIEVVNLANNHTYDYLEKGYEETVSTLQENNIGYFGYGNNYIVEVKGIRIGLLGYTGWDNSNNTKRIIKNEIKLLKNEVDIIIVSFHWGIEREYNASSTQQDLAHFTIDQGADLVIGHHPHVVQGLEEYKGKSIVYSLGNFCFGGNKNPSDKDTFIYQHYFYFEDELLVGEENKIIPCSLSSVPDRNNYQPTPLEGDEALRVIDKIKTYSIENKSDSNI